MGGANNVPSFLGFPKEIEKVAILLSSGYCKNLKIGISV
jgi:hypothetical protein